MSRSRFRPSLAAALAACALPALAQPSDPPGGYARLPETALAEMPAQEVFRGWPPPALLYRPYWLPWSDIAFVRATLFGRPVALVLTTGWSTSAERALATTLADDEVLATLNRGYVSVLVDADRRPDLRERYSAEDWPAVAILLPNGLPMLSQADDPVRARPITTTPRGTSDLRFVLIEALKYWNQSPALLVRAGSEWAVRQAGDVRATAGIPDELASDELARHLSVYRDKDRGGFGGAPKRLHPGFTEYAALRGARLRGGLEEHAALTLDRLVGSPLYDPGAGGLRRATAGAEWGRVLPEKLLDTNADLLRELADGLRIGLGEPTLAQGALEQTAAFLVRELARAEGGFWNAQAELGADGATTATVDELVLAGSNARAGVALVRAGAIAGQASWTAAGRKALDLVYEQGYVAGGGVRHVITPQPTGRQFLVALADTALAFVEAYESLGERRFLDAAEDIAAFAWRELGGAAPGALQDHVPGSEPLGMLAVPRRPLEANARMSRAMLRLTHLGREPAWRDRARAVLAHYCGALSDYKERAIEAGLAVEELIREPLSIRIEGPQAAGNRLRREALASPWPWTVISTGSEQLATGAVVARAGRSERVTDPAKLRQAILRVTGPEDP